MTKKFILLSLLGLFFCPTFSLAAEDAFHKLQRGIVNVVSAPIEIPKQTKTYWIAGSEKTPHIIVWVVSGVMKGLVMTTTRFGSGLWDVISFPLDVPSGYASFVQPDYVSDNWPVRQEGVHYKNLWDRTDDR